MFTIFLILACKFEILHNTNVLKEKSVYLASVVSRRTGEGEQSGISENLLKTAILSTTVTLLMRKHLMMKKTGDSFFLLTVTEQLRLRTEFLK